MTSHSFGVCCFSSWPVNGSPAIHTVRPAALIWDYVTSACLDWTGVLPGEGGRQKIKVIQSYTWPAGCVLLTAGVASLQHEQL